MLHAPSDGRAGSETTARPTEHQSCALPLSGVSSASRPAAEWPGVGTDVVKVRTQASEARKAVSTTAHSHAGAAGPRSQTVAQVAKSSAAAGGKRSFASQARTHAPPPGLYSGPASGVYRHIIRTEGVLGALHMDSATLQRSPLCGHQRRLQQHLAGLACYVTPLSRNSLGGSLLYIAYSLSHFFCSYNTAICACTGRRR